MRRLSFLLVLPFLLLGCDTSDPAPVSGPAATLRLQIEDGARSEQVDFASGAVSEARAAVLERPDGTAQFAFSLSVSSSEGDTQRRGLVESSVPLPNAALEVGSYSVEADVPGGLQYIEERVGASERYRFELVHVLLAVERVEDGVVTGRYSVRADEREGDRRAVATGTFEAVPVE